MLFNPRYGVTGLFVFPYYAFVELLAPVIEAAGLIALAFGLATGVVDWRLRGLWKFPRGKKDRGSMERKGFHPVTAS
jgi:hypothetical protein